MITSLLLLGALHFPVVLMYHRVDVWSPSDRVSTALTVSPRQFSDEMEALRRRGLQAVSIDQFYELVRERKPLDRVVLVTFDDGYRDQYDFAVPILRRYHFGATFFVNTGTIGDRRHLSWQELRAMELDGMSIEPHGVDHVDLATLQPSAQAFEIDRCIAALRSHLGSPVRAFAYPSGAFDTETVDLVREAGLVFGFTTDDFRREWYGSPYDLSRIRIENGLDQRSFEGLFPDAQQPGQKAAQDPLTRISP